MLFGSEAQSRGLSRLERRYWIAYFDAVVSGPLLSKPHTARRRAGDMARGCPHPDIAASGLEKVKSAIEAHKWLFSPERLR